MILYIFGISNYNNYNFLFAFMLKKNSSKFVKDLYLKEIAIFSRDILIYPAFQNN